MTDSMDCGPQLSRTLTSPEDVDLILARLREITVSPRKIRASV